MSSRLGPHTAGLRPHLVPTSVGTREGAFFAQQDTTSPQSPQILAQDTHLRESPKKRNAPEDISPVSPYDMYSRSSGDCGDRRVEAACEGENPVPTPVGTWWGLWGPPVGTAASDHPRGYPVAWSCQFTAPRRSILPQLQMQEEDRTDPRRQAIEERVSITDLIGGLHRAEAELLAEQGARQEHTRPSHPGIHYRLTNANTEAAGLSQSRRPRCGPNRGARSLTGQSEGGVGLPRAVGGRALPDPIAHNEVTAT